MLQLYSFTGLHLIESTPDTGKTNLLENLLKLESTTNQILPKKLFQHEKTKPTDVRKKFQTQISHFMMCMTPLSSL